MKLVYRCLCLVFGALLGGGCADPNDPEYGPAPAEYGMPSGSVHIDGRVLDGEGSAIPGVQVTFAGARPDTTDAQGNYTIEDTVSSIPCSDGQRPCLVRAEDIDGPANGGPYEPVEVEADLAQTAPPNGSWDLGTWEGYDVDIVLDELKPHDKDQP